MKPIGWLVKINGGCGNAGQKEKKKQQGLQSRTADDSPQRICVTRFDTLIVIVQAQHRAQQESERERERERKTVGESERNLKQRRPLQHEIRLFAYERLAARSEAIVFYSV